jgi:hypothetical protein
VRAHPPTGAPTAAARACSRSRDGAPASRPPPARPPTRCAPLASAFFEAIWRSQLGNGWGPFEWLPVKGLVVCAIFAPTIPYFTQIWIHQGMFDLMSAMSPQIKYG